MKALPAHQRQLLDLQDFDNQVARLSHTAKSLPQRAAIQALSSRILELDRQLGVHHGELEDAQTEMRRIESDVEVVQARHKRDSDRLQTSSSVKDIQALESELAALSKRRDDLEEIELTVMQRVEDIQGRLSATSEQRALLASERESAEQSRDAELATINETIENLRVSRDLLARSLPVELVELYEKQRSRYGIGAALLQGGVSLGSNMKLTESDLADVRKAAEDDVLLCPESSAILVRTAESGL